MHVVFERLRIEPLLAEALNHLSGVWAQCSANRDALVAAKVRDVELIGMPWFDDDPLLQIPKPERCDRFLWVGREEFRKSPDRLVKAFACAFKPGEATLTLKVSRWGTDQPSMPIEEAIASLGAEQQQNFHVIRGELTKQEMVRLYAEHDVYCSASRGEGWDLPAYHMKLAGRRLSMTNSGGPRDFAGDGDTLVPASGEVLDAHSQPYADHDVEDLAAALQFARRKPGPGSRPPAHLNSREVGKRLRSWVERLTA
jgi:glycosyltransferase involved in cell wall biosynthesis